MEWIKTSKIVMGSLRKRFVFASLALLAAVSACFLWATWFVENTSARSVTRMGASIHAQNLSLGIRNSVWRADFSLYAYLLEPSENLKKEVLTSLDTAIRKSQDLVASKSIGLDSGELEISMLKKDVERMRKESAILMAVRTNRQQRFPALSRITDSLYPSSLEFLTATSLAMESNHASGKNADDSLEYRLFADSRRNWSRMISSFRLFLAYRTGMMGNSDMDMELHSRNVDVFYAEIKDAITQLQGLAENNQLSFQGEESVRIMAHISENWYSNYQDVSKIHISDEWRLDEPIIRESVQPLSASINNRMNLIDAYLVNLQHQQITTLTRMAEQVIASFWVIAFAIMLAMVFGLTYIKRGVINPISRVASAMKQKAQKDHVEPLEDVRTEELQSLVVAFNHLSQSLEQAGSDRDKAEAKARQAAKMSVVGEMASCIAHEINNPLNNMMRLSELMETEVANYKLDGSLVEDIKTLQVEQHRCADIVQDLLDFGRPRLPSIDLLNFRELIHETVHLLSPSAARKKIKLKEPEYSELPQIYADSAQIKQVLVNLVLNAIEASKPDSEVDIILTLDLDEGLKCVVSDRGSGVDPAQITHIFEPFYTTKQNEKGLGLGLAISYSIIETHGGMMGAELRKGGGLSVWFTIPRDSDKALQESSYERNA
ncbi:MAG TPA: HAMP domain-containing histidine kinase [Chromatiales bacterium]|nr:HAMP domain-containing histidine kinase [Chromatiales bacterium]